MNPKTKILYVDDEDFNLDCFKMLISKKYDVLTAIDGDAGLLLLEKNPDIRIVFSDLQMPYMDGIEFIKSAKEKYPNKKYTLLTSMGITPMIQHALDSKLILRHLRKPINKKDILEVIDEAVKDVAEH